jgi:DNA helicase-2/ATP-dependent DNA helicase PcrA
MNERQSEAVYSPSSRILVLAGAGTGKTRVIVNRIANLVAQGVPVSRIVATTFTNKAAAELKHRLSVAIGQPAYNIICGTFHRISAQFLKQHGASIGLDPSFQTLNEDDQRRIVRRLVKDSSQEVKIANVIEKISQVKERIITLDSQNFEFKQLFTKYLEELRANNYLDYSDLISQALVLFEKIPSPADHILIDEYQDINQQQYRWINLLASGKNLFCVGDEDQAIYSFRGSSIEYIQRFQQDFPDASIISLEENYRSAKEILHKATQLIVKNSRAHEKRLIAADQTIVGSVHITKAYNEFDEGRIVATSAKHWLSKSASIGILVRTNLQVFTIEQALIEAQIPYTIANSKKFFLKKEIQDMLSYLKIILYPRDFIAFSKVINSPKRYIGEVRLQAIFDAMNTLETDFETALETMLPHLARNAAEKCKLFLLQLKNWRTLLSDRKYDELLDIILRETEYMKQDDFTPAQKQSVLNLKSQLKKATDLADFLETIQFLDEQESSVGAQIMTMHGAKGLEFDVVIAPGWEEDVFPSMLARDKKEIEEERRLAYVVITRARRHLEIIYATHRRIHGQYKSQMPSRFLFDM